MKLISIALFCLLSCAVGCGGPDQEKWNVSFGADDEFSPPIRILYNGDIVAEYASQITGEPVESQMIHGPLFAEDQVFHKERFGEQTPLKSINKDFRFKQLTPSGWKEFLHPRNREGANYSTWHLIKNSIWIHTPEPLEYIIIDNRKHKAVTITFGELPLNVAANTAMVYRINFNEEKSDQDQKVDTIKNNDQAVSWKVKLGDKDIGTMHAGIPYLIDVSGQREYALEEMVYSNRILPDLEPYSETLDWKHLHELPSWLKEVRYLFKYAPLETKTDSLNPIKWWQLTDANK